MTFAEIHWLPISISLLQSLFVIVCALMILIILMQRPKQEGLGAAFGGGVTDQVFGARTTNVLQRGTVYLGSMFFIISLALAVLVGQQNKTVKTVKKEDSAKVEKAVVPPAPEKPKKEDKKPSPTSAYVFAALFAALWLVGRILEDRLVKALFKKSLLSS